jgi:hypothetical protein
LNNGQRVVGYERTSPMEGESELMELNQGTAIQASGKLEEAIPRETPSQSGLKKNSENRIVDFTEYDDNDVLIVSSTAILPQCVGIFGFPHTSVEG